jgi:hypothetical protein
LGILDVTIAMNVRFFTNNSMNCQIYNIQGLCSRLYLKTTTTTSLESWTILREQMHYLAGAGGKTNSAVILNLG